MEIIKKKFQKINLMKMRFLYKDDYKLIHSVVNNNLTYIEENALIELYLAFKHMDKFNKKGIFIETGCALGGSALTISFAKTKMRPFYVYDVFGMIPSPSDNDGNDVVERYEVIKSGLSEGIKGDMYYGYIDNLKDKVINTFKNFGYSIENNNIHLIKGLYEETLIVNQPVVAAHIDCDWYDSVLVCLKRIEPKLIRSGILVIDDYNHWSGCKKAVDDYFSDKMDKYDFIMKSRLYIVKK